MNRREHLLTCLAEECTEVGQRVSKALRFGLDEVQPGQHLSNSDRIVSELLDLLTVWKMLSDDGALPQPHWPSGFIEQQKIRKVEKFLAYAESQGAMTYV